MAATSYGDKAPRGRYARMSDICSFPTDQGSDGDCAYHAYSKLFIRNVVSMFVDLDMNPADYSKMVTCITAHPIHTSEPLGDYSPESCSRKGYINIVLFYYFFNFLKRNKVNTQIDDKVMSLFTTMQERAAVQLPLGHSDVF